MVTVAFVATQNTPAVSNYIESLRLHQQPFVRLGAGDRWGGWRYRMQVYRDWCASRASDEVVLLTDADDVLLVRPLHDILPTFLSFQRDIVTGAETLCLGNCSPPSSQVLPVANGAFRYTNAGTIMGRAGALAECWAWCLDQGFEDDQKALGAFLNAHPSRGALDTEQTLFYALPLQKLNDHECRWHEAVLESCQRHGDRRTIRPYFLHFPGHGGHHMMRRVLAGQSSASGAYDDAAKQTLGAKAMPMMQFQRWSSEVLSGLFWAVLSLCLVLILVFGLWYWHHQRTHHRHHGLPSPPRKKP